MNIAHGWDLFENIISRSIFIEIILALQQICHKEIVDDNIRVELIVLLGILHH